LTANAQIWPRNLNSDIGGVSGNIYLIVADIGFPSGGGFDFILGVPFLQRFYSVFDTANQQVGLAYTTLTYANTN
jgi:cathepsin E